MNYLSQTSFNWAKFRDYFYWFDISHYSMGKLRLIEKSGCGINNLFSFFFVLSCHEMKQLDVVTTR